MSKGKVYIGTSGWVYSHWDGIFYPKDLPSKDKLRYFSEHFKTAEINYSFYHLPWPNTCQKWYSETPEDFLFAVKTSRLITHIKRLKGVKAAWKIFLNNVLNLKEKLGPVLFQFPPSFKFKKENIDRLEKFLELITKSGPVSHNPCSMRYAFELRDKSWCNKKIYNLLKKYKAAWVIADSPDYPRVDEITADFVYVRMHGSKVLFTSNYTKKELQDLAKKIKDWQMQGFNVYVYFNNDAMGYAVENAKILKQLII